MLRYESFQGVELDPQVDALAGLRITVFREFPYWYEEWPYLETYHRSPRSQVTMAWDGA